MESQSTSHHETSRPCSATEAVRNQITFWSEPLFPHRILQVAGGDIHLACGALVSTVPGPFIAHLFAQCAVKHLRDVFAEVRQELPRMKRAAGGDKEVGTVGMGSDDPVLVGCDRVPIVDVP